MFTSNVHAIERAARVILGVGLLGAAVAGSIGAPCFPVNVRYVIAECRRLMASRRAPISRQQSSSDFPALVPCRAGAAHHVPHGQAVA